MTSKSFGQTPLFSAEIANYAKEAIARLSGHSSHEALFTAIVNAPLQNRLIATDAGLGILVLLLADRVSGTINRISLSDNEYAHAAIKMSVKDFRKIKIPLSSKANIIAQAIGSGRHQHTSDWYYIFTPALDAKSARFNQAAAAVECSVVYPFKHADTEGAMIFSYFRPYELISARQHWFMEKYAAAVAEKLSSAGIR